MDTTLAGNAICFYSLLIFFSRPREEFESVCIPKIVIALDGIVESCSAIVKYKPRRKTKIVSLDRKVDAKNWPQC